MEFSKEIPPILILISILVLFNLETGKESLRLGLVSLRIIGGILIILGVFLERLGPGRYTIMPDCVKYQRTTFLGTKHWTEPLSRYRGISVCREIRYYGDGDPEWDDIFFIVELLHDSKEKTV